MADEMNVTPFTDPLEIERLLTQKRAEAEQIKRRLEARGLKESAAERKHRTHILVKIGARWCAANGWQTNRGDLDYLDELMEKNDIDFFSPGAM